MWLEQGTQASNIGEKVFILLLLWNVSLYRKFSFFGTGINKNCKRLEYNRNYFSFSCFKCLTFMSNELMTQKKKQTKKMK